MQFGIGGFSSGNDGLLFLLILLSILSGSMFVTLSFSVTNDSALLLYVCWILGSPIHTHNSAWNLLLTGRKRWFLLPPGTMGHSVYAWGSTRHPLTVLAALEKHRDDGFTFEITQYPGDVLYIPHGWAHSTLNLCETVAVAQEFCGPINTNTPFPIASVLYGSATVGL